MASTSRSNGGAAPAVRAVLHAAWVAALAGAIALAALFTVTMLPTLEYSVVHMSFWHSPVASPAEINAIVASIAARTFVASLIFSLVIAAPVSAVVVLCAYPFLHELRTAGGTVSGIVRSLTGALVWADLWWIAPNINFGSWMSWFIVGGLAGCAGGLAFARHLPQQR
jgi:hypothetical protein